MKKMIVLAAMLAMVLVVAAPAFADLFNGDSGVNDLTGTDSSDIMYGNDIIKGDDGRDVLRGAAGDDKITGGNGEDAVVVSGPDHQAGSQARKVCEHVPRSEERRV